MELTRKTFELNESINIKENKTVKRAILFTDMVESSNAWKNHETEMITALEDQSKVIDKYVKKYNGFICKTIGDAYMVSFKDVKHAINCGLSIQEDLKDNPILITKTNRVKLRIGICYGSVYEAMVDMQGIKATDYFGNTVNTASRIESKVCDPGNIAFAITEDVDKINLDEFLEGKKAELISYKNEGDEIKRSGRILTEVHRHIYKNIEELKGVDEIDVYKIKI